MSLLARLAPHLGGFQETTGTEALGLILADPDAAGALVGALRSGFAELPDPLRFVTQAASGATRPDVVGLHQDREIVHLEGKFWAGLTSAQADDGYLARLAAEHGERDPGHACRGVLLWVCPPRRAADLWDTVCRVSQAAPTGSAAHTWRFARTPTGQGVALVDWPSLCSLLEHAGTPRLAEDVRQLRGFVEEVDRHAFLPWTTEQLTDQETPRRQVELVKLAKDIRSRGQRHGILDRPRRRNSFASFQDASGPVIHPGGLWTAFVISPRFHASYGQSPWWLRWFAGGAPTAREALRNHQLVDLADECAVPVPLRPGALREQVLDETLGWLAEVGPLLAAAKHARLSRGAVADEIEDPVPTAEDDDHTVEDPTEGAWAPVSGH